MNTLQNITPFFVYEGMGVDLWELAATFKTQEDAKEYVYRRREQTRHDYKIKNMNADKE